MKIIKYLSLPAIVFLSSCLLNSKKKSELIWSKNYPVIGSQSSPRTEDINKDGTLDIIMGAGKNEFQHSDMGIIAFDGKTGNLIWKQDAPDQVFGSATFCDVNGDSVKDVFIGGVLPVKSYRWQNGKLLWEFKSDKYKDDPILKYAGTTSTTV
jgi:outer membrane protein assembly factor BamB